MQLNNLHYYFMEIPSTLALQRSFNTIENCLHLTKTAAEQ